jgi:ABC-2 type transport system ATP-binding protein
VTTSPGAAAVETRGLSRSFEGLPAVRSLDLSIQAGEMFGLVGPDGAGKTTTIRLLCTILKPTSGEATIAGLDLRTDGAAIRRRIGYLSQTFTLYGDLTVDENLEFFAALHGVSGFAPRREELLEFTRLTDARGRLAEALSGGMKKKLALACTLIHSPDVLLLDEPTTGVDPISRGEFWNILIGVLDRGTTVIMTTPYLDEAERCDRVGLLHDGRLVDVGTPEEIRRAMPGDVFRINCPDPKAAYLLLREHRPPTDLVLRENGIRLWARGGERDAAQAADYLREHGAGPVSTSRVEPSFEDAFVALISSSTGEEPPL